MVEKNIGTTWIEDYNMENMSRDELKRYQYKCLVNPDCHVFTIGRIETRIEDKVFEMGDLDIIIPRLNLRDIIYFQKGIKQK
ncbi:MAG: hypothetical protein ABFQ65_03420 [Nanoarchaeota archaeon]